LKIDLHIHTKTGSDGSMTLNEVFTEAQKRNIGFISITDHDSVVCQPEAFALSSKLGMTYVSGIELNVTFPFAGKDYSLDFLGYGYDYKNHDLQAKLKIIKEHRENRAIQILEKLNREFEIECKPLFSSDDLKKIQESVDGTFGRPHIANYLIKKGVVNDKQEAFDKYLVKCDVPKYPLLLSEASMLIRDAGGRLVLAHPNDPNGTSLKSINSNLEEQAKIIETHMLEFINGVECWHSRSNAQTTAFYIDFAEKHHLIKTGGSDCHQKPIFMGTLDIPEYVARQFIKN
jgi:3',5'-nucleoside bisphosphate phosphatase